jgi:hypothetical protein
MNEPFTPNIPEEYIVVKITKREANLIEKLRKYPYGKFTVHKIDNKLIRIEILDSQMIEDAEVDL